MGRGNVAEDGATMVSKNGYHYTKQNKKWRLTHHIVAEEKLGRPLREDERVSFADKNRKNLKPSNLVIDRRGQTSIRTRMARIQAKIDELEAELAYCQRLLDS